MKITFITNGSNEIGYGHVSRVSILKTYFELKGFCPKIIVPVGFPFEMTDDYITVASFDQSDLQKALSPFEVIIIDSVEEDFDKLSWISYLKIFTVTITLFLFNHKKRFENLTFFPSIDDNYTQIIGEKTKLYAGRAYLSFRDEFKNIKYCVRNKGNNVLISMGGTDPFGLTKLVVNAFIAVININFTILLSSKSEDYGQIQKKVNNKSNWKLLDFERGITNLFQQNDLAIINGGLTRYETCLVGLPFIAISIHQRQFDITQLFVDKGAGINAGLFTAINKENIVNDVENLLLDFDKRSKISAYMRSLFDTNGAERILNIIATEFINYEKDR